MNDRPRNKVLRALAKSDPQGYARLSCLLEPHALARGVLLEAPHAHTDWLYFIETGVVSLVATSNSGHSVEVAVVGCEGVAGIADALGSQPLPYGMLVQLPGLAHRVPRTVIREHILTCSALHKFLMDYSQLVMHQLAQAALCNRFHTLIERLARWLLLTADRAGTNRFELTHDRVAQMVGSPRSAVSQLASRLRRQGIIDYRRGVMRIRSPQRLHALACECFDTISLPLRPRVAS